MILIFPFLLMTLHFSQIGFTEERTFMSKTSFQKSVLRRIAAQIALYHAHLCVASIFFGIFRLFYYFVKNRPRVSLFCSPGDPAFGQVIRRKLQRHSVAGQDPDEVLAKLTADMRQHLMPVLKFNLKHRIGEFFYNNSFDFDNISL